MPGTVSNLKTHVKTRRQARPGRIRLKSCLLLQKQGRASEAFLAQFYLYAQQNAVQAPLKPAGKLIAIGKPALSLSLVQIKTDDHKSMRPAAAAARRSGAVAQSMRYTFVTVLLCLQVSR